jgi:hypothetical protein
MWVIAVLACLAGLYACSTDTVATMPVTPAVDKTVITSLPSETAVPVVEVVVPPVATATLGVLTPIVVQQPTLLPTPTAIAGQGNGTYPVALLQIERPGELSQLSSPFLFTANVYPGAEGMVNVQLFGENGRVMVDQLIQLSSVESGWQALATELKFESAAAGESGLVVVSTRDAYGRRIAQAGVPVILLQLGKSEIETVKFNKQPVILNAPVAGGFARKGNLHIEGQVHLFNNNPVIFELVTQTGGITASRALYLQKTDGVEFTPFSLDLPYEVTKRTPVRLSVRQASTLSPAVDISLYSLLIFLDP